MGLFDKFKNLFKNNQEELLNEFEIKNNYELEDIKKEVKDYDKGLEKTRKDFTSKLTLPGKKYNKVTDEYFEELEEILIMADIGVNTVMN